MRVPIQLMLTTISSSRALGLFPISTKHIGDADDFVVVVGKIIIDDYCYESPIDSSSTKEASSSLTIGGGGPQAAWGAAAALAVLETFQDDTHNLERKELRNTFPPKQPVAFFGPIGGNAHQQVESELEATIGSAIASIHLIREPNLQTPTIQLWHDENQDIQWRPLHDSWGSNGADSLWRNRPNADDILLAMEYENKTSISNFHLIMEVGENAAGGGEDSLMMSNDQLMEKVSFLSIEPVAFPEETADGNVAINQRDVASSEQRLGSHLSRMNLIVPDSHLLQALQASGFWKSTSPPLEVVGRYGPEGSRIYYDNNGSSTFSSTFTRIPAAKLITADSKPINPTGAGNAYSAALSTCRSKGLSLCESACIATAIGAVVCEYEHLPEWNWDVIDRIRTGTMEVYEVVQGGMK